MNHIRYEIHLVRCYVIKWRNIPCAVIGHCKVCNLLTCDALEPEVTQFVFREE